LAKNPLFGSQRESAGSETWEKYHYQYHWALFTIISLYIEDKEFAVFMELHEDVVLSDSLDQNEAKFDFNQVKTSDGAFTEHALVIKKKSGKTVLGKLLGNVANKTYADKVKSINLVATNSFSLDLKDPEARLEKIKLNDLEDGLKERITEALKVELSISEVPETISFVIPELQEKGFQNTVIGKISQMVAEKYPGSYCDATQIYRLLIDELGRKGMITTDYVEWEDVLKKKSLTSAGLTIAVNTYTNLKDDHQTNSTFNEICEELGLKTLSKTGLRKSFNRYKLQKIGARDTRQLDISRNIISAINSNIGNAGDDFRTFLEDVASRIDVTIKEMLITEPDLHAAIICEYIMNSNE
jgi:hypothetical protein